MQTNRTKNSILNAITMITNTALLSILSLISTNIILRNYGSDFNGVVATANQLVNLLLIVEGGFTTAINVALFKPFVDNNQQKINAIMSAAKKTFSKIGIAFMLIGGAVALVYPLFIKSDLTYLTIFLIFLMVIVGTAYNLIFVYKNQIMFQVSQREYVFSSFAIVVNALSSITTIVLAYLKADMLIIRLFILIYIIVNGIILHVLFKRTFPDIDTSEKPDYESIKGTKDIMVQKLTAVVYLSAPLLFISTFISTKLASVYAVYNSIYTIIKNVLISIVVAPVNGFGQLISKGKSKEVYKKFQVYEFIVIFVATVLLAAVLIMILPFINLYTASITDIDYVNVYIAALMAGIILLEIIHVPSGNIINVSGNFKLARKIQTIASIILIVLLVIGGYFFGMYGILGATLVTNLILAAMEIYSAHTTIFGESVKDFIVKFTVNVGLIVGLFLLFNTINITVGNYVMFFVTGIVVFIIVSAICFVVNFLLFKDEMKQLLGIVLRFIKKRI